MEEWACKGTINGAEVAFEPYCPWPMTNKGWDGLVAGNNNITMNDCSMTMGEALGTGYLIKCGIYFFLNFVCLSFNVRFLMIYAEKRKDSKAKVRNRK